jgi:hypothetical protein
MQDEKPQYNLSAIPKLQEALDIQRKYEKEQVQGDSLTYRLAGLHGWSPSFILDTMNREDALKRFDQIWTLFSIAGDIINRYEDATIELLKSPGQVAQEQAALEAERQKY